MLKKNFLSQIRLYFFDVLTSQFRIVRGYFYKVFPCVRDLIFEEHPEIEPDSKEFSQKLLAAFQQRYVIQNITVVIMIMQLL